jgi:hypothetical protein
MGVDEHRGLLTVRFMDKIPIQLAQAVIISLPMGCIGINSKFPTLLKLYLKGTFSREK